MVWMTDPQLWVAFFSLAALEIVLGVDNIIIVVILASRLPKQQQAAARRVGLLLAMFTRILLLLSLRFLMHLTAPLFTALGEVISGRDLILIGGGLFLLGKSTLEIHQSLEGEDGRASETLQQRRRVSYSGVLVQIVLMDIVFSLDSVITAIGLTDALPVMVAAIVTAVAVMMFVAGAVSEFVHAHPSIKILALSFLLLVGVALVGEGFDFHIPRGYIYFAMAFSIFVELLNMKMRSRRSVPVRLRRPFDEPEKD